MKTTETYQQELLETIKKNLGTVLSEIEDAFLNTPRHLFADKIVKYDDNEAIVQIDINDENIDEYLPDFYNDRPVGLAINSDNQIISTISQPTLVLSMLNKLDIKQGQKILELGTASGWNAALMAKLVGAKGHIHSVEIISDLVHRARVKFKALGISNVTLLDGDGASEEYSQLFDRIMFTVGSYDIPMSIHKQLKEGGLLLMVLKNKWLLDGLILFKKHQNHLESMESSLCRFVPLKGAYAMDELDPVNLDDLPMWERLKTKAVIEKPFWWGMKSFSKKIPNLKIRGITSFLGIVEPLFKIFTNHENELFFGLIDEQHDSMVIWKNNTLTAYGNKIAFDKITAAFGQYLKFGMPDLTCFNLKVFPLEEQVGVGENSWLIQRKDSQFLWSL